MKLLAIILGPPLFLAWVLLRVVAGAAAFAAGAFLLLWLISLAGDRDYGRKHADARVSEHAHHQI